MVCLPIEEGFAVATAEQKLHMTELTNEPFIDFSKPENRQRMEDALQTATSEFGREYPVWLGGHKVSTPDKRNSTHRSRRPQVSGVLENATADMGKTAVAAA